jgi:hypothetical protein
LTEAAGKLCEQQQNALPDEGDQTHATSPMAMSADGAMVFVRGHGWQEVQTLVLAEVEAMTMETTGRAREKRTSAHATFSRLSSAETFGEQCSGEISRRGIERAPQVCAIQDGAIWFQGVIDLHRPDAERIPDFFHAAAYVSAIEEEGSSSGGASAEERAFRRAASAQTGGSLACASPPGVARQAFWNIPDDAEQLELFAHT